MSSRHKSREEELSSSSRRARSASRPRLPPPSSSRHNRGSSPPPSSHHHSSRRNYSSNSSNSSSSSSSSRHGHSDRERHEPSSSHSSSSRGRVRSTPASSSSSSSSSRVPRPRPPISQSITPTSNEPTPPADDNSWAAWWNGVVGNLSLQKAATTQVPATPSTPNKKENTVTPPPQEDNVWNGMWNKIKDATAYLTPTKPEDEDVNSALRDYYSKKGGPVPDFLKPQSESRPDDSSLQRFEQRQQGPRPVRPRRRA